MSSAINCILSPEEYELRKIFLEELKHLTKSEYIEIVRILQNNNIEYSENSNGIFFNLGLLDETTFNALQKFLNFTQSNRRDLAARELVMTSLANEIHETDKK